LPATLLLKDVAVYGEEVEIAGNGFTVVLDRLLPGLPVIITVRVEVAADAAPGSVIDYQPVVSYGGTEQSWPLLSVGLPPAELPPTGGYSPAL
jgi:hypothetical protein